MDKNAELAKCYLTTALTKWQAAKIKETYLEESSIIDAMSSKPINMLVSFLRITQLINLLIDLRISSYPWISLSVFNGGFSEVLHD